MIRIINSRCESRCWENYYCWSAIGNNDMVCFNYIENSWPKCWTKLKNNYGIF